MASFISAMTWQLVFSGDIVGTVSDDNLKKYELSVKPYGGDWILIESVDENSEPPVKSILTWTHHMTNGIRNRICETEH